MQLYKFCAFFFILTTTCSSLRPDQDCDCDKILRELIFNIKCESLSSSFLTYSLNANFQIKCENKEHTTLFAFTNSIEINDYINNIRNIYRLFVKGYTEQIKHTVDKNEYIVYCAGVRDGYRVNMSCTIKKGYPWP